MNKKPDRITAMQQIMTQVKATFPLTEPDTLYVALKGIAKVVRKSYSNWLIAKSAIGKRQLNMATHRSLAILVALLNCVKM